MPTDQPSFLTLQCPSCGGKSAFPPGSDRFVCQYCGNEHIFQLPTRQSASSDRQAGEKAIQPRPRLTPRPRQVQIEKKNDSVKLSWRWFSPKYIPLAFFCVAWDAFLCFWYSMALGMPNAPWIMIVFPVAHLAVGVGLTYSTLAGFLNTTSLKIDRQYFIVQHDPMPWTGEIKTPVDQLEQFYCKEKRASSKNGVHFTYQLNAVLKDGRDISLVSDLDAPDIALFLEQQIESWLNIPDTDVAGEYGRAGRNEFD